MVCRIIIQIFFILFLFLNFGCQRTSSLSENEAEKMLVGEYELFIGSNQKVYKEGFISSKLVLKKDGSSEQSCEYQNNETNLLKSSWRYLSGDVCLDQFNDCAGAWGRAERQEAACLEVKFFTPPIILLSPDMNIFYNKSGNPQNPEAPY